MRKPPATKRNAKPLFTPDQVTNISEAIYRLRLGQDDVASMIAKDKDQGQRLRNRSRCYDVLTRLYIQVLGVKPPQAKTEDAA